MSRPLDEYKKKRDFRKTPEPKGKRPRKDAESFQFVVHRHEARHLHYDLRLEMDGVLKSWAVPRGFSYFPGDKRLAVHTEDHPLEYLTFHGVIPAGEYGAGTMTIWDRGEFEILEQIENPGKKRGGKLEIILRGGRLRGEWHLVETDAKKREWLLFKASDLYSREETDRNLPFNFRDGKRKGLPRRRDRMEPVERRKAFSDPAYLFEMEFSGRRVTILKDGQRVKVLTRDGEDLAGSLPHLVEDLGRVRAERAVLDGVLVALDEKGRPSVAQLEECLRGDAREVSLYLFDLLYCEEYDLRELGLLQRKKALAWVLPPLEKLLYVDHVERDGEKLFQVVKNSGLPGMLAKRSDSSYRDGPGEGWLRIRVGGRQKASKSLEEALEAQGKGRTRIQYSNPTKIFWPQEGFTKGDMLQYYESMADFLLPYLRERPLHLNRFPDGIEGKSFYQKNVPDHLPDWIETESIRSEGKGEEIRYVICNDRATLMYVVNMGSIDLHPWLSRRTSRDSPDFAVIDLDPKKAPFEHVVRLARAVGKLLRGIGVRPYLKTSGASGLHVFIPLLEGYTYDHSRMFCEGIARAIVRDHSDIATVDRVIEQRDRRVYVDYLQNRKGQTIVPPYVIRPVPGATVSTPLDWDELSSSLKPSNFNLQNVPERVAQRGDLFRETLSDRQDLLPAIQALHDLMQ